MPVRLSSRVESSREGLRRRRKRKREDVQKVDGRGGREAREVVSAAAEIRGRDGELYMNGRDVRRG